MMEDYRCKFCHRLLGKGKIHIGIVSIKCPKCNEISVFGDKNAEKVLDLNKS
jgi:phage FluMu protein Com